MMQQSSLSESKPAISWKEGSQLALPKGGAAGGIVNGLLVLAGGTYWEGGQKVWLDQVIAYDCAHDRWIDLPPLPKALGYGAGAVWKNQLYYLGGAGPDRAKETSYCLRSIDGRYRWEPFTALPQALCYAQAEVVENTLYLCGGAAHPAKLETAAAALFALPLAGKPATWTSLAPVPGPGRALFALTGCQGKLFLFGGCYASAQGEVVNLQDACAYDPASNLWRRLKPVPAPTRAWSASAWNDRYLFLLGGYTTSNQAGVPGGKFEEQVLRYDTKRDEYEAVASLPKGVADISFHKWNNAFYGAGGEPGMKRRAPWTFIGEIKQTHERP